MDLSPNAASVALIDRNRVLVIQRARAPYQGLWTLPGGRSEAGESGEACAIREIAEELALTIADLQLVEVQSLKAVSGSWRLAVFATTGFSGTITPSDEILDHRWVTLADVAALRTTAGLVQVLAKAFALFPHR